jgi:hypothetical protein
MITATTANDPITAPIAAATLTGRQLVRGDI